MLSHADDPPAGDTQLPVHNANDWNAVMNRPSASPRGSWEGELQTDAR